MAQEQKYLRMDLLRHMHRLCFLSPPIKHLFSFGIVSQSPDIEEDYFQTCCIVSNEGGWIDCFAFLP